MFFGICLANNGFQLMARSSFVGQLKESEAMQIIGEIINWRTDYSMIENLSLV